MVERLVSDREETFWCNENFVLNFYICGGTESLWWYRKSVIEGKICGWIGGGKRSLILNVKSVTKWKVYGREGGLEWTDMELDIYDEMRSLL